ncbi:MAG: hypothetical protein PHG95_00100 [Patescibacteria group bacterium]|nr:hypothetical protein [Patescibacteria group bacterium]
MEKEIRVLFWHNQYPEKNHNNHYFCRGGAIHHLTEKLAGKKLCWEFIGGFINDDREDFWEKAEKADVLFCLPANMDYDDILMHWDGAEKALLDVIKKIKEKNPTIKIFFFESDVHYFEEEMAEHGEFITDLHGDEAVIEYFKK